MLMPDFPPQTWETREQLDKILHSQRFQNASNPSDLLRLAVKRALMGEGTSALVVTKVMFPHKRDVKFDGNDARQTASNLRKRLALYYEREGRDDTVIIALPPVDDDKTIKPAEDNAYTPTFSYNPRLEFVIQCRLAYRSLERTTYNDYSRAFETFNYMIEHKIYLLVSAIGMVETLCRFAEQHWENPAKVDPRKACTYLLDLVKDEGEGYWGYWAAWAAVEITMGDDEKVDAAFTKALNLNRRETENYPRYITFLFEKGRTELADGLANRYILAGIGDTRTHVQFAMFMYAARRPFEALRNLETALRHDPNDETTHHMLALYFYGTKDPEKVLHHLKQLERLCDEKSYALIVAGFKRVQRKFPDWGFPLRLPSPVFTGPLPYSEGE